MSTGELNITKPQKNGARVRSITTSLVCLLFIYVINQNIDEKISTLHIYILLWYSRVSTYCIWSFTNVLVYRPQAYTVKF